MQRIFYLDIFLVTFRESLETAIIIAILLSFVSQTYDGFEPGKSTQRRLFKQIWIGSGVGILLTACIAAIFIATWKIAGKDLWSSSENLYEGILALISSVMITFMGFGMMRLKYMKQKLENKISLAILSIGEEDSKNTQKPMKNHKLKSTKNIYFFSNKVNSWARNYSMTLLPLVTILREGVEAVVFIFGTAIGKPANGYPLSLISGIVCGIFAGISLYYGGRFLKLKYFLIASTCLLYLVAAGLFSRGVWQVQFHSFAQRAGDVGENGSGPGSYDPREVVWHVDCCNPKLQDNPYSLFNVLLGWQNTATYGSIISYNLYWVAIVACISFVLYKERTGRIPMLGRHHRSFNELLHHKEVYEQAKTHVYEQGLLGKGGDSSTSDITIASQGC